MPDTQVGGFGQNERDQGEVQGFEAGAAAKGANDGPGRRRRRHRQHNPRPRSEAAA